MRQIIALGLALLLPGVAATVPIPKPNESKEQQEAIDAILQLGGTVGYDYQRPNPNMPNVSDPKAQPKDPKGFHRVVQVNLRDTKATDKDLQFLTKLPALENIDLTNSPITGAGLVHIRGLKNLKCLSLWKTQVDDKGLENLKDLTKMWQLILDETRITDKGLENLKGMTDLEEWLGLTHTQVTDAGLKHLEGLTKLRSLNLIRTQVTAKGVKKLRLALPKTTISHE